jgi:predicted nucleotide-binding protein
MSEIQENLTRLALQMTTVAEKAKTPAILKMIESVHDCAENVGKSWSRSPLGYHSCIYYEGFQQPPAGAHFSIEWGRDEAYGTGTLGDWAEYNFDEVRDHILHSAGVSSIDPIRELFKDAKDSFANGKEELLSILSVVIDAKADPFLARLKDQAEKLECLHATDLEKAFIGNRRVMSRDGIALGQGFRIPPHISVLAEVLAAKGAMESCGKLGKTAERVASHLQTRKRAPKVHREPGTHVFIGHGRSQQWKDLKDFIQDRLELSWDEFNRVPIAGVTNIERLSQMLDQSAIAFLVLTAEDEQIDGSVRARENVVHEAGLFQGRLGFAKAIVLLEHGCAEFSNISGLGQIRFPKGDIKACFEEIRRVLEREGLIEE